MPATRRPGPAAARSRRIAVAVLVVAVAGAVVAAIRGQWLPVAALALLAAAQVVTLAAGPASGRRPRR